MSAEQLRYEIIAMLQFDNELDGASPWIARNLIDSERFTGGRTALDQAIDELISDGTLVQKYHQVNGERLIASCANYGR